MQWLSNTGGKLTAIPTWSRPSSGATRTDRLDQLRAAEGHLLVHILLGVVAAPTNSAPALSLSSTISSQSTCCIACAHAKEW